MNIVYFGSDVFFEVFKYLQKEHNIVALYTYHNDEDFFNEYRITQMAEKQGIPIYYESIQEQEIEHYIDEYADVLFIIAEYNQKIPVLDTPDFHAINFHSSVLPEGRSYYPIEIALLKGFKTGGITAHKVTAALDRGDIVMNRTFEISENDDSVDIYFRCASSAKEMIAEILSDFDYYWQNATPQTSLLPFWRRPNIEEMTITHNMTVAQAKKIYRIFNKMTTVDIDNNLYHVANYSTGSYEIANFDEMVIPINKNRVIYGLIDGHIRIEIQPYRRENNE